MDFYIWNGQACIGHDASGELPINSVSIQELGNLFLETEKILVADLKESDPWSPLSIDTGKYLLESLHQNLPLHVPFFVTGFLFDWIPLVSQTINAWNGRQVTYFVYASGLAYCQENFRQPGIKFGINYGYPISLFKKFFAEVLPSILEKYEKTASFGNSLRFALHPLMEQDLEAWNHADVKMVWTVTSDQILQEILKYNPDYIAVDELQENEP